MDCAYGKTQDVQAEQYQIRARDAPVKIRLFHHTALGGHVELAQLGIDHRQQHWPHDVPGKYRFINLIPERISKPPLNARIGNAGMRQVGQCVRCNHQRRGLKHMRAEQQVRQRCGKKNQPRQTVEEVQHGIEVTQALPKLQARPQHWIVNPGDLRHSARPANALSHMGRKTLGGQTRSLWNLQVRSVVAQTVELERGVGVFRHSFHCNAAHFKQRPAFDNGAGAAEK